MRAGFQHDSVSTDANADIAGWGAGGTIGLVAGNGLEAVELCGNSRFYFGGLDANVDPVRVVQNLNHLPIDVCAEIPVGF